jgi:hypothetical protein
LSANLAAIANIPNGRALTIVLLMLQLGGCVVDFTSGQQAALWPAVCLVTRNRNFLLETGLFLVWVVLSFSWILGLASLRWTQLRPVYWALILLVPFAYVGHQELLGHRVFSCDVF